ncbi:MAG: tetrahydromethanopterin S-methyltransferase subunit H [Candidatus Thorarchaeota archaeon]|nr:MAG: tetrahydromethanopterin S-methyltransferase subunit H [Candidatus Thorarchaeota archaeon]
MQQFDSEQKTLDIGGVKVGGRPGLIPTVMVGSIFYSKDKLVVDERTGKIDKSKTEMMLQKLADVSEKTGLPSMLDVVGTTSEAIQNYLGILADMTDMPLLIDGSGSSEVNLAGLVAAREAGLLNRVVLNSLTPEDGDDVYEAIQELGAKNAVILTFSNVAMPSAVKRAELADEILEKAQRAGITNAMFDTGVVDLLTLGLACKALVSIKEKHGLPVGCGAHNAVAMRGGLVKKFGKKAKEPAFVGSSLMPVVLGADFVLYGPIKHASVTFPAVAMIDVALSGSLLEDRLRPERPHPRYLVG